MLSIRITDNSEIQSDNADQKLIFDEANRKGNIVKKFKTVDGKSIVFFNEMLDAKMIPKKNQDEINAHPMFVVETARSSIVFQSIDVHPKFLVLGDDGFFVPTTFFDLNEGDDEILCYDELTDDYVFEGVEQVYIIEAGKIDNPLSNYVLLSSTGGIVVNGIMVM